MLKLFFLLRLQVQPVFHQQVYHGNLQKNIRIITKIKFGLFDGLEDVAEEAGYLCGVDVELQYERQG